MKEPPSEMPGGGFFVSRSLVGYRTMPLNSSRSGRQRLDRRRLLVTVVEQSALFSHVIAVHTGPQLHIASGAILQQFG